jgi:hypothetical protein
MQTLTVTQAEAPRSMRLFNEMGDIEVEWTEETDERMRAIIQRKMNEGVRFFQVTIKGTKAKRTPVKTLEGYGKRRIYVADEDIEKAFLDGAVSLSRREGSDDMEITPVTDAAVAARGQTVGMRPYAGG